MWMRERARDSNEYATTTTISIATATGVTT